MSTSKFSSDHETFVQIFQLSCSLENKIYMRVCRKNIRVQCGIIFYHVLFTCAKYFAFCRSGIFVSWDIVANLRYILYINTAFQLSACGARQMTKEWGELNANWYLEALLVHSTRRFGLPMDRLAKIADTKIIGIDTPQMKYIPDV